MQIRGKKMNFTGSSPRSFRNEICSSYPGALAMRRAEALEVLSVPNDADAATVRTAFRGMALKHHPGAFNAS